MGEQSLDVVKGVYEAFGRGDVPAVLGAMADDIEWHEAEGMPYGGVYHGGPEVLIVEREAGPVRAFEDRDTERLQRPLPSHDQTGTVADLARVKYPH